MQQNYASDKSFGIDIIKYIKGNYANELPYLAQIQEEIHNMQTRFPLEYIPKMTIEEYVTVGNPFCFINMIEQKTSTVSSGFLAYNRNRLFYQYDGDETRHVIPSIAKEKRFEGLGLNEIFSIYMDDLYKFIKTFNPANYNPKEYLSGKNVIKSKVIMLYRPELEIAGFTSKEPAKKMCTYLGVPINSSDDSLSLNIKIKDFLINKDTELSKYNMFIVGRLIWQFYADFIDVKSKNNYLDQDRKYDHNLLEKLDNEKIPDVEKFKKRKALPPIEHNGIKMYHRDPAVSKQALRLAKYSCECNPNHETFIKKSTKKKYTEPHHLIPISAQDDFEYSLDVLPNIISLCSNCHNKLHYGLDIQETITQLYNSRKDKLEEYGIKISLEKLLLYYL